MKRALAIFVCALFGIALGLRSVPRQADERPDVPAEKLVGELRTLNTTEYLYHQELGRFADLESLLAFLRKKGTLSLLPVDLEKPSPYEIAITTTLDGMHYQITLKRTFEQSDKRTWCQTAAFSDDRGVIFLGQPIGCDAVSK